MKVRKWLFWPLLSCYTRHVMRTLSYTLDPGHEWKRTIAVKDRRTRRVQALGSASARAVHSTTGASYQFTVTIGSDGAATLEIPYQDTLSLPAGTWNWDLVGDFRGDVEPLADGTLEVGTLNPLTSLEGDIAMLITHHEGTDYRQRFTWASASDGTPLSVSDAKLMATDSEGATVLDLSYYVPASTPDEAAIALLPDAERGYITDAAESTVEVHISELNPIAPGTYTFDLKAKESLSGDWGLLASGSLVVTDTVTTL